MDKDESIRSDASLEALSKLRPVFDPSGSVTAGNSSGINDGAAMLAVATEEYAKGFNLTPLAEIVSYATVGIDSSIMGMGPAKAIPAALDRAGLSLDDIDVFELNEAFASQSIAVCQELKLAPDKVNPSGGAIALGHPIGASGARVVVTLIHTLLAQKKEFGVASLCIGGGMGIALVLRAL